MNYLKLAEDSKASQEVFEMYHMMMAVSDIKPKVIVEIGVDGGGSMETWRKAFDPDILVGIDINDKKDLSEYDMIFGESMHAETFKALEVKLGGRLIDFLFIDGDHRLQAVKAEYWAYLPYVRAGGIIGLHDTNNRGIAGVEVDQFLAMIDRSHSYKTMDLRASRMAPGTRLIWV